MEIEEQVAKIYASQSPEREVERVKVLEDEGKTAVVRVYSHARSCPCMCPTPYANFRFCKTTISLSELAPEEDQQFTIKNYK